MVIEEQMIKKGFNITLLTEEHKEWVDEVYSRLPSKIKKLVDKKSMNNSVIFLDTPFLS